MTVILDPFDGELHLINRGTAILVTQIPVGSVNGVNATFTVTGTINAVFLNGAFQSPSGVDYTLTGQSLVFVNPPPIGSVLYAL